MMFTFLQDNFHFSRISKKLETLYPHDSDESSIVRNSGEIFKTQHCNIHDFRQYINVSDNVLYECVKTIAAENLSICAYPTKSDLVSRILRKKGAFEIDFNRAIMSALDLYPNAAFLDIGANIGMHSLVAAKRGKRVFAVEPNVDTVKRLHKSVNLNRLQENFTLIRNGISDVRESLTLTIDNTNRGRSSFVYNAGATSHTVETILFDDLREVISVPEVVIKIDVEMAEARAFKFSKEFFKKVKVNVIFMEWQCFTKYKVMLEPKPGSPANKIRDHEDFKEMLKNLYFMGFIPKKIEYPFENTLASTENFTKTDMLKWPADVVWVRNI